MTAPRENPSQVYFEFTAIGRSVKVVAIDAATGTEVSVIGPASASQARSAAPRPGEAQGAARRREGVNSTYCAYSRARSQRLALPGRCAIAGRFVETQPRPPGFALI
jgi:hypothetical protein